MKVSRADRFASASRLRAKGWTVADIAAEIGVSRSYVASLFADPDGSKDRARKERYRGVCVECGARTSGSNGPARAPRLCHPCASRAKLFWTRERIIEAIQRFAREHGRRPASSEWLQRSDVRRGIKGDGYPNTGTVLRVFGSWADAVEAAGFERPRVGNYVVRPRNRLRVSTGSVDEYLEELRRVSRWGVAPAVKTPPGSTIRQALARHGVSWVEACERAGVRARSQRLY